MRCSMRMLNNTWNPKIPFGELYAEIREIFEKPLFKIVLEHTNGNRSKAADILGINRNTLHTKLVEYKLVT